MSDKVKTTSTIRRGRAFTTDARAAPQSDAPPDAQADAQADGAAEMATDAAVIPAQSQRAVAPANDYGEFAGAGMDDIGQNEMLMPFIRIVQPTAGILKESSPGYNEAVRQGMMMNTATGEIYDRKVGFDFIPCWREQSYTEWVPVDAGGGFRGVWDHNDPRANKLLAEQGAFKALKTPDGTELVETFTLYGVVVPLNEDGTRREADAAPAVIPFTSTQIKKYKQIITRLTALVGRPPRFPMFAWVWRVTTVPESNKKGDYYGWQVHLAGNTSSEALLQMNSPLFSLAADVFRLVRDGGARADHANSGVGADAATAGDDSARGPGPAMSADTEENIPF